MEQHYFIALSTADETLTQYASALKLHDYYKTVYEPDEYHLTLRFLGALTESELLNWRQRLAEIAQTISPFTLEVDHLERFGLAERPRVFAVGPRREETLVQLAAQLDPEPSKPFVPHITLAKKWNQEVSLLPPEQTPSFSISVKEIVLYKICPADRPRYQADTRFRIGKKQ
ncbi:RNA 2',3'-cyclic phosphodiesterase [Exiguobacterium sp. RIT452]|uniref:RNA 2',3'-cyclic phosphodiesterase n=1 Tax=unclassified Exiguobacterium TaxID=2644629 RepID=UPI000E75BA20|nr:RNA 2',3'-cyclic phosphodiesterase [Exiguobacterium sp. RIT452]RJP00811.1 RNA 2',3'-cyclic phosphodiesterase [Exiguobacterium sp. RIT452]